MIAAGSLLALLFVNSAKAERELAAVRAARDSVVVLACKHAGEEWEAAGFAVGPGWLVSNAHVLPIGAACEVITRTGLHAPVIEVLRRDENRDLVLFRANVGPGVPSLRLSAVTPEAGDEVAVIGHPEGLSYSLSFGVVAAVRRDLTMGELIQFDAAISHGNSGGPVLNASGELVGVTVGMLTDGQNLNFAVSVAELVRLEPRISVVTKATDSSTSGPEVRGAPESTLVGLEQRTGARQGTSAEWEELARLYAAAGRWADAVSAYRQVSIARSDDAYPLYEIARIQLYELERPDEAVAMIKLAISLDSKSSALFATLGEAYRRAGRLREAQRALTRAIELDNEDAGSVALLGIVFHQMHDTRRALSQYDEALTIDPLLEIHLLRGVALHALGRREEALAEYRRQLTYSPLDVEAHFQLAWVYFEMGDFTAATAARRRLHEIDAPLAERAEELQAAIQAGRRLLPDPWNRPDVRAALGPLSPIEIALGVENVPLSVDRATALRFDVGIDGTRSRQGLHLLVHAVARLPVSLDTSQQLPNTLATLDVAQDEDPMVFQAALLAGSRARWRRFFVDGMIGPLFERYYFPAVSYPADAGTTPLEVIRWGVAAELGGGVQLTRAWSVRASVGAQGAGFFLGDDDGLQAEPEIGYTVGGHFAFGI